MKVEAITCPIEVNGIAVLLTVYPTLERSSLPEGHRGRADVATSENALFVAEAAGVKADPDSAGRASRLPAAP